MANDGTVRIGVEFETDTSDLKNIGEEVEKTVQKPRKTIEQFAQETGKTVKEVKKQIEELAEEYQKAGMNLPNSFKQAYKDLGVMSELAAKKQANDLKQVEEAAEEAGDAVRQIGSSETIKGAVGSSSPIIDPSKETEDFAKKASNAKEQSEKLKNALEKLGKVAGTALKVNIGIASKSLQGMAAVAGASLTAAGGAAAAGVGAVVTGIGGLLAYGNQYNSEMETLRTSFEVMTGSAEKAAETLERLTELGAATPYETKDLAETTQLLMNYGLSADKAVDVLLMLGDVAQGDAEKLYGIATAYGQMSSAGKVSLEDIKQMIERGFNPLQEISETTGESMASLYDRITKSAISVDEITASIKRSSAEGGMYFQSMIKQSQTAAGQISTLQDNFAALTGMMAEDTSTSITQTLLPQANNILEILGKTFETSGWHGLSKAFGFQLRNALTSALEAVPELLDMGEMIITNIYDGFMGDTSKLEAAAVAVVSKLPVMIGKLFSMSFDVGEVLFTALFESITANSNRIAQSARVIVQSMVDFFSTQSPLLSEAATALLRSIGGELDANGETLLGDIGGILQLIPEFINKNLPLILNGATGFVGIMADFLGGVWSAITDILTQNEGLFSEAVGTMIGDLGGFLENGVDDVVSIILSLVNIIADNTGILTDEVLKIAIAILDALSDPKVSQSLIDAVFTILDGVTAALDGNLEPLTKSTAKMIETIVSTLVTGDNLAKIIEVAGNLLSILGEALWGATPELIDATVAIINSLVDVLADPKVYEQIAASALQIVWALFTSMMQPENIGTMMTFGGRIITEILGGIINAANDPKTGQILRDSLTTIANEIFDFFKNKDWLALGKGVLEAIWAGLKGENYDFQSVLTDWMGDAEISADVSKKDRLSMIENSDILQAIQAGKIESSQINLPSTDTLKSFRDGAYQQMYSVSGNGAGVIGGGNAAAGTIINQTNNINIDNPLTDMEEEQLGTIIYDYTELANYGK